MKDSICRISEVKLENFKCVRKGRIRIGRADGEARESVLGIYGENCSGKSSVIEALSLVAIMLKGGELPKASFRFINAVAEEAVIGCTFSMTSEEGKCRAEYAVRLGKSENDGTVLPVIKGEELSVTFKPKDGGAAMEVSAVHDGRGLFDDVPEQGDMSDEEFRLFTGVTSRLRYFGMNQLLTVCDECPDFPGAEGPAYVEYDDRFKLENTVEAINLVLAELIPGMTIVIRRKGNETELMSSRYGAEIPLLHESNGVKRLISLIPLFIRIYFENSVTLAVDDIDLGLSEYLVGELLRMMDGFFLNGQLIFTSHTMRPLEILPREHAVFTTIDPCKRYIRMKGIKTRRNMRSAWIRNVVIDEQKRPTGHALRTCMIYFSFLEAGEREGLLKTF